MTAARTIHIAGRPVGHTHPCYIIGEIGINHNGDVEIAKRLAEVAADAGCDAVKIQVRTPELCVPKDQWDVPRVPPWGGEPIPYIEYKRRMELTLAEKTMLYDECERLGIHLFASVWDVDSVMVKWRDSPCIKIPSAKLTDMELVECAGLRGYPVMLSTGMSTADEVDAAIKTLEQHTDQILLMHSVSAYPCPTTDLNLRCIHSLQEYGYPVGYSGHEAGLATTVAAVAMGACMVERHITLDRTMPGTDHAASVEPDGLRRLVRDIRTVEQAMGDGVKRLLRSERLARKKLRGE